MQHVFFEGLRELFPGQSLANKAALAKEAKKYIAAMPTGLYQELLYDELAKLLHVSRHELEHVATPQRPRHTSKARPQAPTTHTPKLTEHCIRLLLQAPQLAQHANNLDFLYATDNTADTLLLKLIHIFKEHPELPIGQLLTHWDDPQEQALITRLAAQEFTFPAESLQIEFNDTLNSMRHAQLQCEINKLIIKSKNEQLGDDERVKLNQLILEKNKVSSK